jgi:hypothetical protein
VLFRAEIDETNSNWVSIKWYINDIEESVQDPLQWSKRFETGTYPVKMEVLYENGETATRTGTLKVQALWIKMRNVRY